MDFCITKTRSNPAKTLHFHNDCNPAAPHPVFYTNPLYLTYLIHFIEGEKWEGKVREVAVVTRLLRNRIEQELHLS